MIDFDAFADLARRIAASIPEEYMGEIETVEIHQEALPHPHVPDVFTLGVCETSHLSDPTGQVPFRSVVHVYYGSFVELAMADEAFDVAAELDETIHHEVQHHLEDRAGIDTLLSDDALFEMHARFKAGMEVPPGWYRFGEMLEPGLWTVDLDLFLELDLRRAEWDRLPGTRLSLTLLEQPFEIDVPDDIDPEEIWTFEGEGLLQGVEDDEEVEIEDPDEGDDAPPGLTGDLHVVPTLR